MDLYSAYLRNSLEAILNPFSLILILLCVTIGLCFFSPNSQARYYCGTALLICFFAFSTGWLPNWLVYQLAREYPIVTTPDPSIRWVVVLGGGHHYYRDVPVNQMLNDPTTHRFLEGVRLYQHLPGAKLILSGGGFHLSTKHLGELRHNRLDNTDGFEMAELASWFQIPKTDIIIETVSINTRDEAIAIKPIVKSEPFYLVTSAIHMPRSMAWFQEQGLHPIAAPAEYHYAHEKTQWKKQMRPDPANLVKMQDISHEYLGLAWKKLCIILHR